MAGGIKTIERTTAFKRDFKRLDPQLQKQVGDAIADLLADPVPANRRFHAIDHGRPKVYSIDVTGNKSHKISLEINGTHCTLRRVGTHRDIDRNF